MKYSYFNDYSEGAHPNILKALTDTNLVQEIGYGEDSLSQQAARLIKERVEDPKVEVHFVSGGTQANLIVIASMLKPYESIISASSGHINTHEAGAVEATGHKIDSFENADGKIKPEQIIELVKVHEDEHMVKPKVVFISNSTEVGTIYSKLELEAISKVCKANNLYLYLDGARLGSALASSSSDLSLSKITKLVDIFYIGGTKNGALFGEAIVIKNPELQIDFRRHLKQRGALLAKGRVLGAQFVELFKGNLYLDLAKHANEMAEKLVKGIGDLGYGFLTDSSTNQVFPIFPNSIIDKLREMYGFYVWARVDKENSAIRLVTSWATKESSIEEFLKDLRAL